MEALASLPYVLDTAGRIWPFLRSAYLTSLFRISVELREPVSLPALSAAARDLRTELPGFFVRLRPGFFWSYIEAAATELPLSPEGSSPCVDWSKDEQRRGLIRFKPYRNRIAVEFSHALTDGGGAMVLVRRLVALYLHHAGKIASPPPIEGVTESEPWENAFRRYAKPGMPATNPAGRAFRPRSRLLPRGGYRLTSGSISSELIKEAARRRELKVGEYLTSLLIAAVQELLPASSRGRRNGVIRVLVPVDLRRFFPTSTLRNFFGFIAPEVDPRFGRLSLEEIAQEVRWQTRGALSKHRLLAHFSQNVRLERSGLLRFVPGLIKRVILGLAFPFVGESRFSASLSNLGRVELPVEVEAEVVRFVFAPPPSPYTRTNCSVVSFGAHTVITFGSTAVERDLEREFFRLLRRDAGNVYVNGVNG